jgi:hypothetical protein
MAYRVVHSRLVEAQAANLPPQAREDLRRAAELLAADPWQGQPWRGASPEYRSLPFGRSGLAVYLIREQATTVVVLELVWVGQ